MGEFKFLPALRIRLSAASTTSFRLYFTRDTFQILSATSTDGETWSEESGVRIGTGTVPFLSTGIFTGASVLPLYGGGYRILYSIATSSPSWQIISATSSDGLGWANEAVAFTSITQFIGSPQLIKLSNGNWRIYFLRDSNGGNDLLDREIDTAVSSNEGVAWSAPVLALSAYATSISAIVRSDQRARVFLTRPLAQETTSSVVLSALASDSSGASLNLEAGVRLSTPSSSGSLSSNVVFHSTSAIAWRMLYSFQSFTSPTPRIFGATTLDPDPQGISPSRVLRTAPAGSFTIAGEVFDSTPTATLTLAGETDIPGTSVVRNSDLSLTATFDTSNKALGSWSLVVTNSDGHQGNIRECVVDHFCGRQREADR